MANISMLYVDTCLSLSFNVQISKAMGLSTYMSIVRPNPQESHALEKGQVKSKVVSIDVEASIAFKFSKDCCALVDQ